MPIQVESHPNHSLFISDSNALDLMARFDDLGELCQHLNDAYRRGEPLVSDTLYDRVFLEGLRQQQPDHPFPAREMGTWMLSPTISILRSRWA